MSNVNTHHLFQGEILIVEDNTSDLRFLSDLLKEAGYKVRPAGDGELALRSMQARLPELILLDIKMPGMDGYEVCRRLKNSENTRDIPVIFISALDEVSDKVKAFSMGGVDFITKPFEVEEVLARVKTHLSLRKAQNVIGEKNAQLQREIAERKKAKEELEKHREHLEELVQERTAKLEERNKKLEHFNKLFVDREFRVKALKDRIKELDEELRSKK